VESLDLNGARLGGLCPVIRIRLAPWILTVHVPRRRILGSAVFCGQRAIDNCWSALSGELPDRRWHVGSTEQEGGQMGHSAPAAWAYSTAPKKVWAWPRPDSVA